jgi:trans-aconitate methyltransferase
MTPRELRATLDCLDLSAAEAGHLLGVHRAMVYRWLPVGAFDLVHARVVPGFLPKPAETIGKMAAALKPEGWLLLEAADNVSPITDPSMTPAAIALSKKGRDAMVTMVSHFGYDREYGRHLYHDVSISTA